MYRSTRAALALAALVTTIAAGPAAAQDLITITDGGGFGSYAHSNGDKVAHGRFNTLHTVWEYGALVKYSTSADGNTWTAPALVAPGVPAAQPAISSDSNGTLTVVFVAYPDASTGLGEIHYAYKPWAAGSWTVSKIINSGMQPDIETRGGTVHVTWTTIDRVQYTSFPTTSPPPAMTFGEEIEVELCPGTGFLWPSVTLARESCELVPKVAYLRYSDELSNPDPACASLVTEVGPRVCERDPNSGSWSLEYTDILTETLPAQGVEAVSLSMNAQYSTGNVYLAWSDISNGNARAHLAHGHNGTWDAVTHDNSELHVHVAAKRSSTDGEFRLSWVSPGWFPSFFVAADGHFRTGEWASGGAPTWTDPTPLPVSTPLLIGLTTGHPQSTFWSRCASGNYTTVEALAEIELICTGTGLGVHFTGNQSCPPIGFLSLDPCGKLRHALLSTSHDDFTHVDAGELGAPAEIGSTWATFFVPTRHGQGWITVSWDRGRVASTWDGGFSIDNPQAVLRVQSQRVEVSLERLASTSQYDDLTPQVCELR